MTVPDERLVELALSLERALSTICTGASVHEANNVRHVIQLWRKALVDEDDCARARVELSRAIIRGRNLLTRMLRNKTCRV